ncbi:MAG: riboflavin biosynthesis protein RibF [Desulfovibrionaceae bacterium]
MLYIESFPACTFAEGSCIIIGNFESIHNGHQEILKRAIRMAGVSSLPVILFTFSPHPQIILYEENMVFLYTDQEKERLLYSYAEHFSASNVPFYVVTIPFTKEFAEQRAEHFIRDSLITFCNPKYLIMGANACIGNQKERENLDDIAIKYRIIMERVPLKKCNENIISSTLIRKYILAGAMKQVTDLLNRPFSFTGRVIKGCQRGSTLLGYPTANITVTNTILPPKGVYAVVVKHKDIIYKGVMNIGINPTFFHNTLSIEIHILNFSGEIYSHELTVYCVEYLRDEERFVSPQELVAQIKIDVERTKECLMHYSHKKCI